MKFIAVFFSIIWATSAHAQHQLNLQVQGFNMGLKPAIEFQSPYNDQWDIIFNVGVLVAEENNWSTTDEINSRGVGAGLGLLRTTLGWEQLQLQLNTNFWFREVTREDVYVTCPIAPPCFISNYKSDSQMITILPSVGFNYVLSINDRFQLVPNATFGYQHNTYLKGESIPNSTLITAGIKIGYRLKE